MRSETGSEEYRLVPVDAPDNTVWGAIGSGIRAYNRQCAGDDHSRQLCFLLRGPDSEIAGGLIGATYWDWLEIKLLWVREDLRGRGYGTQLLALAEDEARRRGATRAYLDTFSFQAPAFYQRHGYQVFGALNDFPAGQQRFFLTKEL